jgi:hypothetical protein
VGGVWALGKVNEGEYDGCIMYSCNKIEKRIFLKLS